MKTKFDYKILDKDVIVNQILPHKNKIFWNLYLKGCQNNWFPSDIPMSKDIQQWTDGTLTEDEKLVIKRCLGFFAGSESLVSNNLLLNLFPHITDAEYRQYVSRQNMEEALHNHTIVYICDSLRLDVNEVYSAYANIPSIKAKDEFLMEAIKSMSNPSHEDILNNIIMYYLVCEGMLFYAGFAILLAFGRQQKIPGTVQQITYTLRDESVHVECGIELVNIVKREYPELWTEEFQERITSYFIKAAELEYSYAKDILPRGVLGLNSGMFMDYIYYIGNRRLASLGLSYRFPSDKNPFPWLSEIMDLEKVGNYFETRVQNYRVGALQDDY